MTESEAGDLIRRFAWGSQDCWQWGGRITRTGTPVLSLAGDGVLAHRTAYRLWREAGHRLQGPLRPNVVLLQTCGNRICVSPFHGLPVDPAGSTPSPRGYNRRKKTCPRGHLYAGENLKVRSCGRRCCRTCHREGLRRSRRRRKERAKKARREFLEMQPDSWLDQLPYHEPLELQVPVAMVKRIA